MSIRESRDHNLCAGSPKLIADFHALRRLLMPRHPPCALSNLIDGISNSSAPAEILERFPKSKLSASAGSLQIPSPFSLLLSSCWIDLLSLHHPTDRSRNRGDSPFIALVRRTENSDSFRNRISPFPNNHRQVIPDRDFSLSVAPVVRCHLPFQPNCQRSVSTTPPGLISERGRFRGGSSILSAVTFPVKAIQKLFFSLGSRLSSMRQREVQDHPNFGSLRKAPSIFFPVFFPSVGFTQENIGKALLMIVAVSCLAIGRIAGRADVESGCIGI